MSVALHPSTALGFHRPFTQLAKRSLTITNNNALPIAFKVKTTAPKLYCVRPNSGRVEPGQSVEVSVMLQAMKEDPPPNARCKDKFLIQSTVITPEKGTMTLQDIWAVPEGADDTNKVHQQKLKVVYLPPDGQPLPEEVEQQPAAPSTDTVRPQTNGVHHPLAEAVEDVVQQPSKQDPQRSVTPHNEYSFAREESHDHEEPTREVPIEVLPFRLQVQPPPLPVPAFEPPAEYVSEQRTQTPEPDHVTPLPVPPPQSSRQTSKQVSVPAQVRLDDIESHPAFQELLTRYNTVLLELEQSQLRNEYASSSGTPTSELRQRRKGRSEVDTVAGESDIVDDTIYHQDGVPLQVVVIIALAVFITTYLFL